MQNKWHDVHTSLVGYIRDELGLELPDDLVARAEESVTVHSPFQEDGRRVPDVAISDPERWKQGESPAWSPGDDSAMLVHLIDPEASDETDRWVEIRSAGDDRLVTAIEVVSPSNKTVEGRPVFDQKIRDFLQGGANVVEIDLVRGGRLREFRNASGEGPDTACHIFVMTPAERGLARVYPCPLREPIPAFSVPLRSGDPTVTLALQPLIDRCYRLGRYWTLDREQHHPPALSEADLSWARGVWDEAVKKG